MSAVCPECGGALGPEALEGLCAQCLMKVGLGSRAGETGPVPSAPPPEREAGFEPPDVQELAAHFPQLEILELVGRGGMGAVFRARQKELDREVALKILPPALARRPGFAERFAREAKALAKLNHPHIVAVYEFGQADGLFYFVMELIDGISLRQLLASGKLAPKEALAIVPQICEALQFAHDRGVVHRDIKPGNILLTRQGEVKITDFGIAKLAAPAPEDNPATDATSVERNEATTMGTILGTPKYMAPEQASRPCEVDHRADIYSLGVVFYQMLTGELPSGKFERPSSKVLIDVRLDEVVLRALAAKPERRYQQAGEMQREVETITNTWQTKRSGRGRLRWPGPLPKVMGRWWLWLLLVGLLAAGFWLVPGTGVRISGPRKSEIEVLDARFEPLSTGKNVLHVTVFNRFSTPKTLAVHIQTYSRSPRGESVGWGRPYFVELSSGATRNVRLPFKLNYSPSRHSEIALSFYALASAEDYAPERALGKKITFRGSELKTGPLGASELQAASEEQARAARNVLGLLESHLQQDRYAEGLELLTGDCRLLEHLESPGRLSERCRGAARSFWNCAQALSLQPGKVLVKGESLQLEARCEDAGWSVLLAQESGQWKIDSISESETVEPAVGQGAARR